MATAGPLFTRADGVFVAYNATTGDELWSVNVGSGITAAPITTISSGSRMVATAIARRCTSVPSWVAARCSISGSSPVCSP